MRTVLPFSSLLLISLILAGCASTNSGVGASSSVCCPGIEYQTFTVSTQSVPGFLEPLLKSNLSTVLSIKGLQPVEQGADLEVTIGYEQDDLAIAAPRDDFDERVSEGGDVRYIARIVVTMTDTSGEKLFEGSVQRIHEVSPGEYMHTGRASAAIYAAFEEMLSEMPGRPALPI
jgi:hypothetical protein